MSGLYAYPKSCAFGRVVSKAKLFGAAKASASLREKYSQQVSQIRWAYKLYPEGLNLTGSQNVPEIQIFTIALKTPDIDQAILAHIDRAVTYPIIFELTFQERIKIVASYKRPPETARGQRVCSDYFDSQWHDSHVLRDPLPIALELEGLYGQLIRALMPYPPRNGETLQAQMNRIAEIKRQKRICKRLEVKAGKEKQFNRRVKLNDLLLIAKEELNQLVQ